MDKVASLDILVIGSSQLQNSMRYQSVRELKL